MLIVTQANSRDQLQVGRSFTPKAFGVQDDTLSACDRYAKRSQSNKRLVQVFEQIIRMFQTDRATQQAFR